MRRCFKTIMGLSRQLEILLAKRNAPSALLKMKYKGIDLTFKTDEEGNAVILFIGQTSDSGHIKGERYARTLKRNREGEIIKDHWERKGKAS